VIRMRGTEERETAFLSRTASGLAVLAQDRQSLTLLAVTANGECKSRGHNPTVPDVTNLGCVADVEMGDCVFSDLRLQCFYGAGPDSHSAGPGGDKCEGAKPDGRHLSG
jgi:hypothetical protein